MTWFTGYMVICMYALLKITFNRKEISLSKTSVLMGSLGVKEISTYVQSIINNNMYISLA